MEKNRVDQVFDEITSIMGILTRNRLLDDAYKKIFLIQISDCLSRIKENLVEPFNYFPDINLWLVHNRQHVGVCTIKSCDVIWSKSVIEKGDICNQIIYTNIKVSIFER